MREFKIRPRIGEKNFNLIESLIDGKFPNLFKEFMKKYGGLSIEEDYYLDDNHRDWIIAFFYDFSNMYQLTKEFKENNWGVKVPFANDPGGWHFCLSFEKGHFGEILVNRWTDHEENDQFIVIAESFENFINGLRARPEDLQ